MRNVLASVILAASLGGCLPNISDEVEEGVRRCEDIVNEEVDQVWEQCTTYYEEEVMPQILAEMDALVSDIRAMVENEIYKNLFEMGCVHVSDVDGWDCSASDVCIPYSER